MDDDDDLPVEYDVIVVGTGLVESVVAAACSRIGKKVLHLDRNSYYGQLWATFNLEHFEQWIKSFACKNEREETIQTPEKSNQFSNFGSLKGDQSVSYIQWQWYIPYETSDEKKDQVSENIDSEISAASHSENIWSYSMLKKVVQKFNIDLSPRVIFSKGPMVDILIKSGVSRYTEFISVHNVLLYLNSVIESVPYSKSDVFSTRSVSLVDKRILMKLLQEIQSFNNDLLETSEFKETTFYEYLIKFQIPENIEKYILYSIARLSKDASCADGIRASQIFLKSLGVYGNSPFLWPLYGSSELAQAFCRLCAVHGGIYCLNRSVDSIIVNNNKCEGIISGKKELHAEHVVMSSKEISSEYISGIRRHQSIVRGILITDRGLNTTGKGGASVLHFPSEEASNSPVTLIELDSSTFACPNGLYVVHLIKEGPDNDYKEFGKIVEELFQPREEQLDVRINDNQIKEKEKPNVIFRLYFTLTQLDEKSCNIIPQNLHSCPGPIHSELDYFSALETAESIFKEMFPSEQFLPSFPTMEE